MGLNITSYAPPILSQGREIYNKTGILIGGTLYSFTPNADTDVNAGTFQNLSECWLKVSLGLDYAKSDDEIDNYCFVLAPGQVKNIHFHGEYVSDTLPSQITIVEEPTDFIDVDCDMTSGGTPAAVTDSDIRAFVDITLFRA